MTVTALIPASIRHKNPGAMGLGSSAKRFGATKSTVLNDGDKNTIATFPTSVDGAGAMFHLLYTAYADMDVWDALHKWGPGLTLQTKGKAAQGRNETNGYVASIEKLSSFKGTDVLTQDLLKDASRAIEFGKAMSRHEAGIEYPMTDAQWAEAHGEFLTVINGGAILVDRKQPKPMLEPLAHALSHLGEKEIPGSKDHNDFILQCFKDVDREDVKNDETAWCAAFLGAMLKASGCAYLKDVLEARKYLLYGHALDEPEVGCVVIFWRVSPSSWEGHVAIIESFTATTLTIVGGNQGNAVSRMTVPRTGSKSQVLGYRRAVSAEVPTTEIVLDVSMQRKVIGGFGAVGAFLWSVWDGLSSAAHFAGEVVGILPDTATSAQSAVDVGQQLTSAAGVPWPIELGLFITVCAIAYGAYGTWQRLRTNNGALTKAPYETDEPIGDVEAEVDDAFAAPVAPAAPTFTQAQVDEMIAAATTKASRKPRSPAKKKVKVSA